MVIRRKSELYREVNLATGALLAEYDARDVGQFLCECDDETCSRRVQLSRAEFEAVSAAGQPVVSPECSYADCSSMEK